MNGKWFFVAATLVANLVCASGMARGQGFGLIGAEAEEKGVTAKLVADVEAIVPGEPFTLGVKLDVPKGYYVYYKTPGSIGLATKISFAGPDEFVVGPAEFPGPEVKYLELGKTVDANYVYKRPTFVLATVVPPDNLAGGETATFSANVSYQYCKEDGSCFPPKPTNLKLELPVSDSGAAREPSADAKGIEFARKNLPVPGSESPYAKVSARFSEPSLGPNQSGQLTVQLDVEPGFHLQMNRPSIQGLISTDVILDRPTGIKAIPLPAYPKPSPPAHPLPGMEKALEYRGKIEIPVTVTADANLKGPDVTFSGIVRFQSCNDEGTCYPPVNASFSVRVPVGDEVAGETSSAVSTPGSSETQPPSETGKPVPSAASVTTAESGAGGTFFDRIQPKDDTSKYNLAEYILFAFLGGLILNVMPCVLPVIAIKVLSFVNQAGQGRLHIFLLNLAYSAGVISVFLALATLAVMLGIGWGGLFQLPEFNLVMAGLVFAMGLSLLGVFEIPVPGLVGSSSAGRRKEGPAGAFMTGIFATLLATPCSGPFLGVTLGWSLGQPPAVTYLVWAMMGVGMASPYLVIGMFPATVRWLPKPGNWMVTFKEIAGLALMATVIYIIWTLDDTYVIPALIMLMGLALGFWMIGNLYDVNSHIHRKNLVRVSAIALSAFVCILGFTTVRHAVEARRDRKLLAFQDEVVRKYTQGGLAAIQPEHANDAELQWIPFSEERLEELIARKKTVLVDFTADWCATCKTIEALALNTKETRELVDKLGVVTLYADYTHVDAELKRWLDKFQSKSVPFTVIFPSKDPEKNYIPLRDVYSKSTLLDALRRAGPSEGANAQASVAPSPAVVK